jgi:hypothetical protein
VVPGGLPHYLRFVRVPQILHEHVEVSTVAARRGVGNPLAIWREAAEVVDGIGRPRKVPLLPGGAIQRKELRPLVAARVHAEEEPVLLRRVLDAGDPFLVEGQLLRPAGTSAGNLPRLGDTGDVREEGDAESIGRPGGAIRGPYLEVAGELVVQALSYLF